MKEDYKLSPLSSLPDDWMIAKIKDIASVKGRIGYRGYTKADLVKKGEGALTIGAKHISSDLKLKLDDPEYISWAKYDESPEIKVEISDILLVQRGSIGKVAIVNELHEPATINPSMVLIRSRKCENAFLYYYLTSEMIQKELKKVTTSTAVPMISQVQINNFDITLPPLAEQVKIVEVLSTADAKIESINTQILEFEKLKEGLMQQLLTNGINHTEFKKSELGYIPAEWVVSKLNEVGCFSKGKGLSKAELIPVGIPCIRYGEIYTVHHYIVKDFYSFISEETAQSSHQIKSGDILFTASGETVEEIGKAVAFIGKQIVYAGGDIILLTPNNIDSIYLTYCLNSEIVISQRKRYGQGNSVVHISAKNLGIIKIPVPPIEEQRKIAKILLTIDEKLNMLIDKKFLYEKLKTGLLQQLLTGKIRVNLHPQQSAVA
jgi:type I restriction enzyme S subunit